MLFPSLAEPSIGNFCGLFGAESVQAGTQKSAFCFFWGGSLDDRAPSSIPTISMGGVVGKGLPLVYPSLVVGPEFLCFSGCGSRAHHILRRVTLRRYSPKWPGRVICAMLSLKICGSISQPTSNPMYVFSPFQSNTNLAVTIMMISLEVLSLRLLFISQPTNGILDRIGNRFRCFRFSWLISPPRTTEPPS